MAWLESDKRLDGAASIDYDALWRWSVGNIDEFWQSIADYFAVRFEGGDGTVLARAEGGGVAGAHWFPGARLSYVEHALDHPAEDVALVALDESGDRREITYGELGQLVARARRGLAGLGVGPGDRVAAVLPNGAHAVVAFLATASLGAIWSSCAPEFGAASMVDRFRQIAPKVLIVVDGYRYGGKSFDLADKCDVLRRSLPSLQATVLVPALAGPAGPAAEAILSWDALLGSADGDSPRPERVDFEHPLWILYSSGTTGLPKPIMQGHGGILLEHLKVLGLHTDVGPGTRLFWFSTTGWMMWNFLVGGLLVGATIVCYDGSPVWPDQNRLWEVAATEGINVFGTSAPFIDSCRRAGLAPRAVADLSRVKVVGSTGAPLSPEGFAWASREIGDDVQVASVSGGTDLCTAFIGSCPLLPVYAGELQCRMLGASVEAYDEDGQAVVGEVGELVISEPMPSMPLLFWGDDDGARLRASYFESYPGVWRHGDWVKITDRGTCIVYGRSDATLNRGGVRMGTSEFYRVVETLPGVADSLVVDTTQLGVVGKLILFVVKAGTSGDDELVAEIRGAIRRELSPRHVPDTVLFVSALPRTLSGKKVEVPVRRILLGAEPAKVLSADAMADPAALDRLLAAIDAAGLR